MFLYKLLMGNNTELVLLSIIILRCYKILQQLAIQLHVCNNNSIENLITL